MPQIICPCCSKVITYNIVCEAADPENLTTKISALVNIVCGYYEITPNMVKGLKRDKEVVKARHCAMYFLSRYTSLSLKEIGLLFGGRDHTTVIAAIRNVKNAMELEDYVYYDVLEMEPAIKQACVEDNPLKAA